MTSTKELFASGINYILRDIKDNTELFESGTEYLERVQAKLSVNNKAKHQRQIAKIKNDLSKIKENIKKHKRELKHYVAYFGYTEEDFKRLNLHPATDEEIEQDYQNDLKEIGYDKEMGRGKYTQYEHECLVQRVNAFNKANDLPIVHF
jgi:chromosome segregation ATPase